MKKITNLLVLTSLLGSLVLSSGCSMFEMSDKEYRLRKLEIESKASHPKTYDVITIEGPFEMKEGAKLIATSPTQPWPDSQIPDGQELKRAVIRDVITGAIIGYGFYRIGQVSGGDKTTINNYNTAN